jgi:hypothetical protein
MNIRLMAHLQGLFLLITLVFILAGCDTEQKLKQQRLALLRTEAQALEELKQHLSSFRLQA